MSDPRSILRPTVSSSAYVLGVAATAGAGFVAESPWPILISALFALPTSHIAVPGYYLCYGILALIPGANPSRSSGSGSSGPGGLTSSALGEPATWFIFATGAVGVLALSGAALFNVLLFRMLMARRRTN